jgi:heme oxygenase (biliverdin-IX-beta and delta-forming)
MSNTGVTLSSVMKEQTEDAHQALEKVVVKKIKAIRSKEEYEQLLNKFYGFHFPLEQWFDKYLDNEIVPLYTKRRRAEQILKDLAVMGHDNPVIQLASELPTINSLAKALGAFYVMEGSTQGGTIVADMLIRHAEQSKETTSFFYGYGDDKSMWASFKEKIDTYSSDSAFSDEMVNAANETFEKFREWMIKD